MTQDATLPVLFFYVHVPEDLLCHRLTPSNMRFFSHSLGYEIMQPPKHTPTLLFPCGHTFCTTCVDGHIKANQRKTCPYCRRKIESQAPNVILQQLIDGFAVQKAQAAAGTASNCMHQNGCYASFSYFHA
jgi:hypothetical protein